MKVNGIRRVGAVGSALVVIALVASTAGALEPPPFLFWWGCAEYRPELWWHCESAAQGEFYFPLALAVDAQSFVYVADTGNSRIQKFTQRGAFVAAWPVLGSPSEIAVAPSGTVYASTSNAVCVFTPGGVPSGRWTGDGSTTWSSVTDLAVDGAGFVYVLADAHVFKFSADGTFLLKWGGTDPTHPGDIPIPRAIACDAAGRVFVMDCLRALQVFDGAGTLLWAWPSFWESGHSWNPESLSFDGDGNLIMTENNVKIYSPSGDLLTQWSGPGTYPGARDAVLAPNKILYVVDVRQGRIEAFGRLTAFRTSPPGGSFAIDSVVYTAPAFFDWPAGSVHVVAASPAFTAPGCQYRFAAWSDGGARAHSIVAADPPQTYEASYSATYWVDISAGPGVHVRPESRWVAQGAPITIEATFDPPFGGIEWVGQGPGSYTGSGTVITVAPQGPLSEYAYYVPGDSLAVYDFCISASETDPFVNTTAPANGPRRLYFWMTCAPAGLSAFEADVTGTLDPDGFVTLNGVLNVLDQHHLLLAVPGCPQGIDIQFLLGYWTVMEPAEGGTFCLAPSPNGLIAAVDCDQIDPHATNGVGVLGYDSAGGEPCHFGMYTCGFPGRSSKPIAAGDVVFSRPRFVWVGPNPFRKETAVRFALGERAPVKVAIYDVLGRLVATLGAGERAAGEHELRWAGTDASGQSVAAGMYFLRLETPGGRDLRKVVRLGG